METDEERGMRGPVGPLADDSAHDAGHRHGPTRAGTEPAGDAEQAPGGRSPEEAQRAEAPLGAGGGTSQGAGEGDAFAGRGGAADRT